MINEKIYDGVLFIGDPHLWSLKPGRRKDASFLETVLGKLQYSAELSNEKNLYPVCLGDFFHSDLDSGNKLQTRCTETLNVFNTILTTVSGNHDRKGIELSYENPLKPLLASNSIHVIDTPGVREIIKVRTKDSVINVLIGATPYGYPLPRTFKEATGFDRNEDIDFVIWITHDDLAFDGPYPGSVAIEEITDIDIVVNGHIHNTKRPVLAGSTVYHNPGNITRLSIDNFNHTPSVWEWNPEHREKTTTSNGAQVTSLIQHVLPHKPSIEVLNSADYHTKKAQKQTIDSNDFVFIQGLAEMENHRSSEKQKTDDGTYAKESINAYLDESESSEEVRVIIHSLLNRSIQAHQEKNS